ncbi:MAG TPA: hypothetical protein VJ826_00430 [Candidatus Polarisedimenticolaceae bacterium]|nr:hypothetical protein [Candidatus Polarisedimenticolaceae bacterium]
MTRPAACVLTLASLLFAACDKVPTADIGTDPDPAPTATPPPGPTPPPDSSGTLRLEVGGTSCGGEVRWTLNRSTHNEDHDFPWSQSITAHSGDAVSLRACSDACGEEHDVTIIVSIFWKGNRIATRSKTGETREDHCTPNQSVDATLP